MYKSQVSPLWYTIFNNALRIVGTTDENRFSAISEFGGGGGRAVSSNCLNRWEVLRVRFCDQKNRTLSSSPKRHRRTSLIYFIAESQESLHRTSAVLQLRVFTEEARLKWMKKVSCLQVGVRCLRASFQTF